GPMRSSHQGRRGAAPPPEKKNPPPSTFFANRRNTRPPSAFLVQGGDPRAPRPRRRPKFRPGQTFLPKSGRGRFLSGTLSSAAQREPARRRPRCHAELERDNQERAHAASHRRGRRQPRPRAGIPEHG